jgi:hypothetical protein
LGKFTVTSIYGRILKIKNKKKGGKGGKCGKIKEKKVKGNGY